MNIFKSFILFLVTVFIVGCVSNIPTRKSSQKDQIIKNVADNKNFTYKGIIVIGIEAFYFRPSNINEKWWVDHKSVDSKGWEDVKAALSTQTKCSFRTAPCKAQMVKVLGNAKVTKYGRYGHLGKYTRSIRFMDIKIR